VDQYTSSKTHKDHFKLPDRGVLDLLMKSLDVGIEFLVHHLSHMAKNRRREGRQLG